MNKVRIGMFLLGLMWSGGMITAATLKLIDIDKDRDFYIGVFGGSAAGLSLTKKKQEEPTVNPDDPATWPKEPGSK